MYDDTPQWRVIYKGYGSNFLHLGISWVREVDEHSVLFGFGIFYVMFKRERPTSIFMR